MLHPLRFDLNTTPDLYSTQVAHATYSYKDDFSVEYPFLEFIFFGIKFFAI